MMSLDEFMKETIDYSIRPRITCGDGFSVSIQASSFHYCHPRGDRLTNYSHFELGYPSLPLKELDGYAESDKLTKTVYSYVPKTEVENLLKLHGEIKEYSKEGGRIYG